MEEAAVGPVACAESAGLRVAELGMLGEPGWQRGPAGRREGPLQAEAGSCTGQAAAYGTCTCTCTENGGRLQTGRDLLDQTDSFEKFLWT